MKTFKQHTQAKISTQRLAKIIKQVAKDKNLGRIDKWMLRNISKS